MKCIKQSPEYKTLLSPAFYNPWLSGKFEIKAGFHRLEKDFGNGELDARIFQIDDQYENYLNAKEISANNDRNEHYLSKDLNNVTYFNTVNLILALLKKEYPGCFNISSAEEGFTVKNKLTDEFLSLDPKGHIDLNKSRIGHPYKDGLDALCMQLQEDISIVNLGKDNMVSMLNICFPNHWAPETKIGNNFIDVHQPVPHMKNINKNAYALMSSARTKGPFVRFAWGISTSRQLNCHPDNDNNTFSTRDFENETSDLYVRLERQTLINIPETESVLFTIRTYFYNIHKLSYDNKIQLINALKTMGVETRIYKGLDGNIATIIKAIS